VLKCVVLWRKQTQTILNRESATNPALAELRQILKDKFATAHRDYTPRESLRCGVDWIDQIGLEKASLCEISSQASSPAGGAVILGQMLRHIIQERQRLVLIDGADSFDPSILPVFEGYSPHGMGESDLDGYFIWARCRYVAEAVKVADMILRDGNLPRTIIDLQQNAVKEIREIPASSWLRLRSLAEDSGVSCLIMTPTPSINCASMRFEIQSQFSLDDLECPEFVWKGKNRGSLAKSHRLSPVKADLPGPKLYPVESQIVPC